VIVVTAAAAAAAVNVVMATQCLEVTSVASTLKASCIHTSKLVGQPDVSQYD